MERYGEQKETANGIEAGANEAEKRREQAGSADAPALPLAVFQVITDTHIRDDAGHIHNRHFENALEDLASFGAGSLGIMHVGDVTDRGLAAEYREFRRLWNERPAGLPELYVTLGNHDIGAVLWEENGLPVDLSALNGPEVEEALDGRFRERAEGSSAESERGTDGEYGAEIRPNVGSSEADGREQAGAASAPSPANAAESLAEAAAELGLDLAGMAARLTGTAEAEGRARELWERRMARFAEGTGEAAPYHDHWLGGYHFIFLGSESPHPKDCDLSGAQLEWLRDRLGEDASADKPIFVFLHQPLKNTVAGSTEAQGWHGVNQDAALSEALAAYPQAILFSGHTHWQLEAARTMFDGHGRMPSMFNASSVAYLWTDGDEHLTGSEGLQVEVYADRVVARGRDFVRREWIGGAEYTVVYPVAIRSVV
ncbi:metallophosphoesterase [Saccharibacillus sp. O23]|uniref:metallophosphoesterase family protein n=1 Tax=Saccharibacillus sp. O23 TaxID=2009338 RepID=UPI0015C5A243|nr:metallophosphoesterase [Saccharibacillus sp. O23]